MATEASLPSAQSASDSLPPSMPFQTGTTPPLRRPPPVQPPVLTTIYAFPSMEPLSFAHYPANQLALPLRRDILHRAVIYEGDKTRAGTANTKWRDEIAHSKRKLRPQKGTGRARLGDAGSPMLRGGGVAFGPKPRDFSTDLPKKIYDIAWRTALSYRYRKGELVVIDGFKDLEMAEPRWVKQIFEKNRFGHADGRSLVVTSDVRPNLYAALLGAGEDGLAKTEEDVDVKDLLATGRIIIEKGVFYSLLSINWRDIHAVVPSAVVA